MIATDIPFRQYADTTGYPLDSGYLYFGEPNQNPETAPITVYWDAEGTLPALQPIRTINGFAVRNGNIANVFSDVEYSLAIKNARGVLVSYSPSVQTLSAPSGAGLIGMKRTLTNAVATTLALWNEAQWINARSDYCLAADGVANDTVRLQAALTDAAALGRMVFVPDGTYKVGQLTFPAGLKGFVGAGIGATKFVISGTFTDYTPIFTFNGMTNFEVGHFSINAAQASYAKNHATQFVNCSNGTASNIYFIAGGFIAMHTPGCHDMTIRDITVDAFEVNALLIDTCYRMTIDNVRVPAYGASHTICVKSGYFNRVINCHVVSPNSANFGILLYADNDSKVANCTVVATLREGIQVTNGSRCSVLNNEVFCQPGHNDFGISVFSESANITHNKVSGNTVYNAGAAGIGISASGAPFQTCSRNVVSDNLIINPNTAGIWDGSAVYLLGGSGCVENVVENNRCVDTGNKMTHGVKEAAGSDFNVMKHNACVGGAVFVQEHGVVGAATEAHDLTWTSFTTAVTATSGAITTASGTVKYKRRGRQADISATATITTNGTGAGGLRMTLPFTIVNGCLTGHGMNVSGKMVQGYTGGAAAMLLVNYDNTYPGATGELIRISGTVEI